MRSSKFFKKVKKNGDQNAENFRNLSEETNIILLTTDNIFQFSSVTQSCSTLCDPMNRSTPGLPVHHQLPEFTQSHVQTIALTRRILVGKVMSLLLNMLSRLVITFLPRSKRLLISWLQSPFAVILESRKTKSDIVSTLSPSISHVIQVIFFYYIWKTGVRIEGAVNLEQ